jgi:hypothetical protein
MTGMMEVILLGRAIDKIVTAKPASRKSDHFPTFYDIVDLTIAENARLTLTFLT